MEELPFPLEEGELILSSLEAQIVPDNGLPQTGRLWLTTARFVARWNNEGGPKNLASHEETMIRLIDVVDVRLPGGPLIQVLARGGIRLSVQARSPVVLRQAIEGAVQDAQAPRHSRASATPGDTVDTVLHQLNEVTDDSDTSTNSADKCSRCSGKLPEEARFCPHCGQFSNPAISYCRRCEREYPLHYQFCAHCGDPLAAQEILSLSRSR